MSQKFIDSRFHHEWVKPQDLGDLLAVNAMRSGRRVTGVCCNRNRAQPFYVHSDLELFRQLSPHVCRAFAIADSLDLRNVHSQTLESTLDALACGVYLADRQGRVVYMNRVAEDQIKGGKALRIVKSRISPGNPRARELMRCALTEAIVDETKPPLGGTSLAIPDGEAAGLVATILPLDRGERRGISAPFAAAAAVFVQDPNLAPTYPGEAFAKLYRLTGAELRVLLAMAPGLGVKEAAAMLGVGEVTARTHLQHIFSKTGTSKQTELLNLLKNSTPPVKLA